MTNPSDRDRTIALLTEAQTLARRMHEPILDYLIERALDEAQASASLPGQPQAPYEPTPANVTALIIRAAKRGGQPDQG